MLYLREYRRSQTAFQPYESATDDTPDDVIASGVSRVIARRHAELARHCLRRDVVLADERDDARMMAREREVAHGERALDGEAAAAVGLVDGIGDLDLVDAVD